MDALKKAALVVFCVLIVVVGVKVVSSGFQRVMSITENPYEKEAPPQKARWHRIESWSGEGRAQTPVFDIPGNEWRVSWNTDPGVRRVVHFTLVIRDENGLIKETAARVRGQSQATTTLDEGGRFYLDIDTNQYWEIEVTAKY